LAGANLEGATLESASLIWANLKKAKLAGVITVRSIGLTPERQAKTISTPEDVIVYTNAILEQKAENICKDLIIGLPGLFRAACLMGIFNSSDPAIKIVAENLKEKLPFFCNVKENVKLTKDVLLKGGLGNKEKSNYLALTTLAQCARAVNGNRATISSLPAELVSEIGKFLLTDVLPEKNAYNLADFITKQRIPNPREAALETFASKVEKSICKRDKFAIVWLDVTC
jgi:hypothetical protein